jgi:hypothetical protein
MIPILAIKKILTAQQLADLDEARDYDAASSYNFLNAQLKSLKNWCASGGTLQIMTQPSPTFLTTEAAFMRWVRARYPHADLSSCV